MTQDTRSTASRKESGAAKRRARAEAIARQAQLIERWRAGQYSGCFYDIPAMLRIDGDEVVASLGARFPIAHAKRGLAFVRKAHESGKPTFVTDTRSTSARTPLTG